MRITKPNYYDRFHCIAALCPDSCCQEWEVQVDPDTAAFYQSLEGSLGDRLRQVLREEDGDTFLELEGSRCPMWREDGLCRIQAQLGEDALCKTCREYPRLTHDYGSLLEQGLALSCPEAARLILLSPPSPRLPVGEEPSEEDGDSQDLALLIASREKALALLAPGAYAPGEALALLLLYGCQAQSELDGAEEVPFDPQSALESAHSFAKPGEIQPMLDFFGDLELLTERWKGLLRHPQPVPWAEIHLALARYLTDRYWLQAVSDFDLYSRVKLIVISCLLVKTLGGDPMETAQLFSKEIENSTENVEALLDAAYGVSAFTDDKLLYLLLKA